MMRATLFMFLAAVGANAAASEPDCSCAVSKNDVVQDYRRADAVFVGRAIAIGDALALERPVQNLNGGHIQESVFQVIELFKGEKAAQVAVFTDRRWSCSFAFQPGTTYLVYAWKSHRWGGALETSRCIRTVPISEAAEDMGELPSILAREKAGK